MLKPGSEAPEFTLMSEKGDTVRLGDFRSKNFVVLVFYPGDDTMICTQQLCEFRDHWESAQRKNTLVFGVNPQSAASHGKFQSKHKLPFPLLIDPGQKVGEAYHTRGLVAKRTVYLIGPDGVIRYAKRGKPEPAEVLAASL